MSHFRTANLRRDSSDVRAHEVQAVPFRLNQAQGCVFAAFRKLQEDVGKKLDQLYVYASMRRDENTADSHYQDLANRIETFASSAVAVEGRLSRSGGIRISSPME